MARVVDIDNTARKVSKYGAFSGPYFPVFGLDTGKYGPEKLGIWTLFTQCKCRKKLMLLKYLNTIFICPSLQDFKPQTFYDSRFSNFTKAFTILNLFTHSYPFPLLFIPE